MYVQFVSVVSEDYGWHSKVEGMETIHFTCLWCVARLAMGVHGYTHTERVFSESKILFMLDYMGVRTHGQYHMLGYIGLATCVVTICASRSMMLHEWQAGQYTLLPEVKVFPSTSTCVFKVRIIGQVRDHRSKF